MSEQERALAETVQVLIDELDVNLCFLEGFVEGWHEIGIDTDELTKLSKMCEKQRDVIAGCRGMLARNMA